MKKSAHRHSLLACYFCSVFLACDAPQNQNNPSANPISDMQATITQAPFGHLPDGSPVRIYTLTNQNGVEARITNYGGIVVSLKLPDKNGYLEDVVLGYDSLGAYLADNPYFGALVGRYGNRIADGQFSLDGETYQLAKNNGPNHLHGGLKGFDKVVWEASGAATDGGAALRLTYLSEDMEEGYPGNLGVEVVYTLTNDDVLRIEYSANTDKKTILNLTHHSYFNLTGNCKRDILDHELRIHAEAFVPINGTLIPTGEIRSLDDSPLDFRSAKPIGRDIDVENQQLAHGQGYDHCWVLNNEQRTTNSQQPTTHNPQPTTNNEQPTTNNQQRTTNIPPLTLAAEVSEPESGRAMEVWTTEPGMQFYSGNFLDGTLKGKGGVVYRQRYGFCLETQHFPDSPNQPGFPSTVLEPGETFRSVTEYRFKVEN